MKKLGDPATPDSGATGDANIDAGIEAGAATPEAPADAPIASPNIDAAAMPASGGSFIRQPDGSLVREGDA